MAYNLIKTNGSQLVTVPDGTIDATATSITLVGKNYPGYGQFVNENMVKLLENFSNSSAPNAPLQGQLWFNEATKILSVYSSGAWKSISGAQNTPDEPVNKVAGDLWFDSVNQQLKVYSGTAWILIGPSFTSATGASGAFAETVTDTSQFTHVVVKFLVQNRLVAILSKDAAFTPQVAINGFPVVNPGLNLANNSGLVFYADAYNSQRLGGVLASQFARIDQEPVFNLGVVISNPIEGLEIRESDAVTQDFTLTAAQNRINFTGARTGWGMRFITKPNNLAGATYNALTVDSTTGELLVEYTTPTSSAALTPKSYVDAQRTAQENYVNSIQTALTSYVNLVWANANVTYSNVSTIQSALGISPSSVDYNKVIQNGSTNFASNITSLWTSVATLRGNVLNGYLDGTTPVSSLWSNVNALTARVTSVENNVIRADGTVTMKGLFSPDTTNTRSIGTSALRFFNFFANTADFANLVGISTLCSVTSIPNTDNGRRTAGTIPVSVLGNVTVTGNLNFNQASAVSGASAGVTSPLFLYGDVTTVRDVIPLVDNARNIGSASKRYANVHAVTFRGVATSAQYADVAERYHADYPYPVGTLVQIGGPYEITQENDDLSEHVLGVISSNPAYLMNSDAGDHITHPAIAMVGRTPVRVTGRCVKGDRLVSAGNGIARRARPGEATHFNVVGRALHDKDTEGENLVEAVILLTL